MLATCFGWSRTPVPIRRGRFATYLTTALVHATSRVNFLQVYLGRPAEHT